VTVFTVVLRAALALGFCIDAYVGLLSLFAPQLIPSLLDIPVHDPELVRIAGGEYVVAALLYLLAFAEPRRLRVLLWLCALDQAFAVAMPALAVAHGTIPSTWATVAPIPFQALLGIVFALGALRRRKPA
jgi:hypothetical protein